MFLHDAAPGAAFSLLPLLPRLPVDNSLALKTKVWLRCVRYGVACGHMLPVVAVWSTYMAIPVSILHWMSRGFELWAFGGIEMYGTKRCVCGLQCRLTISILLAITTRGK